MPRIFARMCNELPDDARAIKCLYRYPEHDDRCRTHSDVCSPRLQVELLAKYVWGGKQGTEGYTEGDWTLTTKQLRIVEVHQQEIASPEHCVDFHEGNNAGVACHRASGDESLVLPQEECLPPVEEVAGISGTEDVEQHHHCPQAKGGREQKIFRAAQHFSCHWVNLSMCAPTMGIIHEEEIHPACPIEHTTNESEQGLASLSLDENTDHHHHQAHESRTYENMENNLYGIYDAANDKPNYLRHSVDDQYNNNVRLGAMLNFTFLSKDGNHKYQLKNIFNQLATSRYTWRDGVSAQSNLERSAEYYYRSRTTYNGQLTGKHTFTSDALDWSIGYAYANRHLPDRRRYLIDDALESGVYALSTGNDISREWTQLDEHILSLGVNDKHHFKFGNFEPDLQVGAYGEYRSREYQTRNFIYNWNVSDNNLPSDFRHSDIPTLLSSEANMGYDKLYLLEEKQMRNNYRGHNTLGAGYLALSLPFGKLGIHAGVRFEHNDMELISNSRDYEKSESSRHYKTDDVFPSLNTTYKISDQHQVRLSYGRSINRPEFREVSSSVYYDFDLASNVQGNTELKNCYVDNLDLRYEWYPSRGELISLAVFYKHFDSPIEWTYTVAGGTDLIYSYKNAKSANNYGVELDIRKNLGFIGLKDFSWSFNGALIKSKVQFEKGSKEEDRPMQGQSPYLINTGIFYKNEPLKMDIALLYNRIGKRIIGVGRSEGSTGDDSNARVPHSYEMPRNTIDFSLAKKFGDHLELKLNVRDLLAEKIYYKQFADVTYSDGSKKEVEEIARCYKPGRNIGLQAIYKF